MRRLAALSVIMTAVALGALAPAASADIKGVPYGTLTMGLSGKTVNFTLTFPYAVSSFDFNFKNSTAAVDSEDNLISMSASGFPAGSCKPNGGGAEYPGCGFDPVRTPTFYWPTVPANTPIVGSVLMSQISSGDTVYALAWNGNGNPFIGNGFLPVAQTHEMSFGSSSTPSHTARAKVPKVIGKILASAEKAIRKAGLKVGAVRRKHSSHVRKGDVISQSVSPGKSVAAGTKVGLVVSTGK
jgi:PASTA domain